VPSAIEWKRMTDATAKWADPITDESSAIERDG
jgi:hypothetical protein